jgi:hypothetical protein
VLILFDEQTDDFVTRGKFDFVQFIEKRAAIGR